MKKFLDENFMLQNETAVKLYHDYAKDMPIIDYHCHLSPKEIAEDKKYKNITEIWLGGDHYKWRVMRSFGITEDSLPAIKMTILSSKHLQKQCHLQLVIRCITGHILNYNVILELIHY